jgi:exopolyphosphatase / guanosine-5'-triphosphate,3'-diphosphate pyrophosphatase
MDIRGVTPNVTMRVAAIDIGTNTVLMLIADVERDGSLTVVADEHFIGRLGKGVDEHGMILQETFVRIHDILAQLKVTANSCGVHHLVACGTSALRDASNSREFIDFIQEKLGFQIQILSGLEEAEGTYLGAVSEYLPSSRSKNIAVLDIGGGSTELVMGTGENSSTAISLDIGSVRLTERILKSSPPESTALAQAIQYIQDHLRKTLPLPSETMLIGVAGTLTTLAALDLRIPEFDRNLVNRHTLSGEAIDRILEELRPLSLEQLHTYPQIHPARADILLAGIIILRETLKKVKLSKIIVSDRGLRYGIALKYARSLFKNTN